MTHALSAPFRKRMSNALAVVGLVISFSVFIILMAQVWYDVTFDRTWPDSNRIYTFERPQSYLGNPDPYMALLNRPQIQTLRDASPAIEAVGLAESLAFVLIISTSLCDQFRITSGVAGSKNLYYLSAPGMQGMEYRHKLKLASYPEIGKNASFTTAAATLTASSGKRRIKVMMADPEILDIIPLRVQEGTLDLFRQGSGVILTASSARKFFPERNMVGESISIGPVSYGEPLEKEKDELTVVAVAEDPNYSILADFDVLCPMGAPYREAREIVESDMAASGFGYLVSVLAEMQPGTDTHAFEEKFCRDIGYRYKDGMMYPFRSLYYLPVKLPGIRQGERLVPQILSMLGILLLLSALLISTIAILRQSWKAAKTNPAIELKKE